MKLNLGCGGVYKKGYLNVDAYDKTVADKIMSASDLEIDDSSIDEIYASQLIEHLGIAGSLFCFSECFRVLKPGCKLIVETPDLKKSFEEYLNGGREARKNLLPWIYGVDIPGMVHRFCYPDDLLEETLKKIGFENIAKENFEVESYQPILKVTCVKPYDNNVPQFISKYRKKLLQKKIIDLDDQLTSLEQNNLLEFISQKMKELFTSKDTEVLREIIIIGAVQSPTLIKILIKQMATIDMFSNDSFGNYLETIDFLEKIDYPNVLLETLKQTEGFVGEQDRLLFTVSELGAKTIDKLLNSDEKEDIKNKLKNTSKSLDPNQKIKFLSQKLIMLKSNRFFQIGCKNFVNNQYDNAIKNYLISMGLDRNDILNYWNLARIYKLQNREDLSNKYYNDSLKLLSLFSYEHKENLNNSLETEIKDFDNKKYSEPIISLNQI